MKDGAVEISYKIAKDYRNLGLATEMTTGLVVNTFKDNRVKSIVAHTIGEENPSTKVLTKCGFVKVEEIKDQNEGTIWKWKLK